MNPYPNHCYRFIGSGPAHGVLQRVVIVDGDEVLAVQDSPSPNFSWLGTKDDFFKVFVFVYGPAPGYRRG